MMARLILTAVFAVEVVAIAIIAAQNGTPVSVSFLFFQSVSIPLGVMLAFYAAAGLIGTALFLYLWKLADQ